MSCTKGAVRKDSTYPTPNAFGLFRMRLSTMWKPLLVYFGLVCLFQVSYGLVVGIDLGSDSFKVVLVRPGSIDIVLNEGSGRKTVSSVGYSSHGRLFGEQVQQLVRGPPPFIAESAPSFPFPCSTFPVCANKLSFALSLCSTRRIPYWCSMLSRKRWAAALSPPTMLGSDIWSKAIIICTG